MQARYQMAVLLAWERGGQIADFLWRTGKRDLWSWNFESARPTESAERAVFFREVCAAAFPARARRDHDARRGAPQVRPSKQARSVSLDPGIRAQLRYA